MASDRTAARRTRSRAAAPGLLAVVLCGVLAATRCFAALPVQPKRPASSYILWLNSERPNIVKKLGKDAGVTDVAKEAGVQWAKLTAAKKKPYEAENAKLKAKYEADKERFLKAGGTFETKKTRASAKKPKKDPNAPKRPVNAYMLWLKDNRAAIVKKLPAKDQKDVKVVAKEAGAAWKKATKATKTKYEKALEKAKAAYQKELAAYEAAKA